MSDPTLTAKAVFDTDQATAGINALAREIQSLGRSLRTDVGTASNEAMQHSGGLIESIKEMKSEGVQASRMMGFYGAALQDIGLASKGATQEIGGIALAMASGSWVLAGIEGARALAKFIKEAGSEAEKIKKIEVKFEAKGEASILNAYTKLNVERMRAQGASEKEIRSYEAVRGNEAAVAEIRKDQAPIMERIAELTAKQGGIEATIQSLGKDELARKKNLQDAADAYKGKIAGLREEYDKYQEVINKSMESAKKAGEINGQAADEEKARTKARTLATAQAHQDSLDDARLVKENNAQVMRLAEAQGKAYLAERKREEKADDEVVQNYAKEMAWGLKKVDSLRDDSVRKWISASKQMGNALGTDVAGMILGTKSVGDAFVDMADIAIDAVVDMVTKQVEAYAVQAAAGAAAAESGIPIFGPALAVAAAAAMGAMVKGLLSGLKGRADGGPVAGGTPYIVGERGPELFLPSGSGTIVPHEALTSGSSGGGMTVNVTTPNARGFERMLDDNRGGLARVAKKLKRIGRTS